MEQQREREIEERLGATTPGPWRHGSLTENILPERPRTDVIAQEEEEMPEDAPYIEGLTGCRVVHTFTVIQPYQHVTGRGEREHREWTDWLCRCEADARFFAHAKEDITYLLAEVRRLRGEQSA